MLNVIRHAQSYDVLDKGHNGAYEEAPKNSDMVGLHPHNLFISKCRLRILVYQRSAIADLKENDSCVARIVWSWNHYLLAGADCVDLASNFFLETFDFAPEDREIF